MSPSAVRLSRDHKPRILRVLLFVLCGLLSLSPCWAQSQTVLITFEGLQDQEPVLDYYNGGRGGFGSGPGPNYGITFGSGALAIIGQSSGGTGNFEGNPSGKTIGFFLTGGGLIMNVAAGFTGGFSFDYAAASTSGAVTVYDGPNATGNVLATIPLPVTGGNCGGSPFTYSCWKAQGVSFSGTARSVNFGGVANLIGFDDITLGSQTPAPPPPPVITTTSVLNGTVGIPYSTTISARDGTPAYNWTATGLPDHLSINVATGVISGTPALSGTYPVMVQLTDKNKLVATQTIQFVINDTSPALVVSPGSLQFSSTFGGDVPGPQTLTITIPATASTPYTVTVDDGAGGPVPTWINVTPLAGATPGTVQVSILPNNMVKASYPARIRISGPSPATPINVAVTYVVGDPAPLVTVAPSLLRFIARVSAPGTQQQSFVMHNPGGGGSVSVSAAVANNSPWITNVSTSAPLIRQNAPVEVTVSIDTHGLAASSFRDTIHVTTSLGAIDVPVSLFVAAAGAFMSDSPDGVRFITRQGNTVSKNQPVSVRNLGDAQSKVNWTATVVRGTDVASVSPPAGVSLPGAPTSFGVNLQSTAASTAGGKSALIQVSDPNSQNSPQYFVVVADVAAANAPPVPDPDPAGLIFIGSVVPSAPQPAVQHISVGTDSSVAVPFSISTSTNDGAPWLGAVASSATTSQAIPAQITVSILNIGSLSAGIFTGYVNIGIGTEVRSVTITLIVSPSTPGASFRQGLMSTAVETRAAACTPSSIAIAQFGLVSNFSVPAGWPALLTAVLADNCANRLQNATLVASFSNGDPPLSLTGDQTGVYTATWQPGASKVGMAVTLTANSGTLQPAELKIVGNANPNTSPAPSLVTGGVLNNLNAKVGAPLAPGTVVGIYGNNMAAAADSPTAIPLPGALDGVEAIVGGLDAPLYYVSPGQLTAQIPFELAPNQTYPTVLVAGNQYSVPKNIDLVPIALGTVAFADGTLVAQHSDYTLVDATHPAHPGESLTIYLVGMGATNPPVKSGNPAPGSPLAMVPSNVVVTVDTQPAAVSFAGLTPGGIGLYQINFAVPPGAKTGNLDVGITQDGIPANATKLIVAP
jgi:uncharacterized protein (TIGR03437 family)